MFHDKTWIKMPKWTIFEISILWKHQCFCFHYWDYLTNIWRNNWRSMFDRVEGLEYWITRRKIAFLLLFRTYKIYEWYLGGCHPIWQPHRGSLSVNRWKVGGVSQKGLISSVKSERNNKKGFYTLCNYLFFGQPW